MGTKNEFSDIQEIIPSDETYPIVNLLFQKKLFKSKEISTDSLIINCLNLIDIGRIEIDMAEEIKNIKLSNNPILKKGQSEKEMELMKNIKFKINSKEMKKLNHSEQIILKMFKDINKNHEFDLKSMYERMAKDKVAINFAKYFIDYTKALEHENKYNDKNYKDIIQEGEFTLKGNESNKKWQEFKNNLKSNKEFYQKEELFDKYLIYGRCFEIEKSIIKNIEKTNPDFESNLFNFLKHNGNELLKLIFDKGISNSKIEIKGDGSVPIGNSKYFVPGFGWIIFIEKTKKKLKIKKSNQKINKN